MDDPTWNVAPNWQAARALIEKLHGKGVTVGYSLHELLDRFADPGPGYGYVPPDPPKERTVRPLPPATEEQQKADAERQRVADEKYELAREKLVRRAGLHLKRVSPEELRVIREDLAKAFADEDGF